MCADCDAVVPRARGAAGRHALCARRGHVERRLHLCRDGHKGDAVSQKAPLLVRDWRPVMAFQPHQPGHDVDEP